MPPNTKQRQVAEIVRCGKDPSYFINKYVQIQHPLRGRIAFDTYDFQDDCLHAFRNNRFNIIVKSRQLGLSTLTAAYATWLALFRKDKSILVIATKLAVAQNFIKKVKTALAGVPKWLWITDIVSKNTQGIEFSNGSGIKAVPTSEDAGRSEALSLLIVDEAAFIRNFDELWKGLYPTLSTGGRAIIVSTPNGAGGQYYDLYTASQEKQNEFHPTKLPWDVHPERGDEWFSKECRNLTTKQVAQELLCDFQTSGDTFVTADDIARLQMQTKSPMEMWGPDNNVWVWKYCDPSHEYFISADVSRGDGADFSTFHIFDCTSAEVICEFKGKIPPDQFADLLIEASRRYRDATICPENNTYGYAVLMKLKEAGCKQIYFEKEKYKFDALYGGGGIGKAGFSMQTNSRAKILTKLEEVLRNGSFGLYSTRLTKELKTFIWQKGKAQAQRGSNDDLVISLAIGLWVVDVRKPKEVNTVDINQAMLAAFAMNSQNKDNEEARKAFQYFNSTYTSRGIPVMLDPNNHLLSGTLDFKWLI